MRAAPVIVSAIVDATCAFGGFYVAYLIRFTPDVLTQPAAVLRIQRWASDPVFLRHALVGFGMAVVVVAVLARNGLYSPQRGVRYSHELVGVLNGVVWMIAFGVFAAFIFAGPRASISRAVLFGQGLITVPVLFARRFLARKAREARHESGDGGVGILIVGAGRTGRQIDRLLSDRKWLGVRPIGYLDDDPVAASQAGGRPVLGTLADFEHVAAQHAVAEVWITIPSAREKVIRIVEAAAEADISVLVVPDMFNLLTREVGFQSVGGFTVARLFEPALTQWQRVVKRVEDVVAAVALILLFLPVSVAIAVAVKWEDGGRIFFRQQRIGVRGRPFTLYKFRSMREDVDEAEHRDLVVGYIEGNGHRPPGELYALAKRRGVTRVGRLIRRFYLDEVPQLWNVLKGEMSIVGPRPPLLYEHERYSDFYKKRLVLKPGITGLWQVSPARYKLEFEQLVLLDIRYINEWSPWLDLRLMMETATQMVKGRGV